MSLVFFFQSSSSDAFLASLLTQSFHLSLGLPRLLLPCSRNAAALFVSLSSAILSTWSYLHIAVLGVVNSKSYFPVRHIASEAIVTNNCAFYLDWIVEVF